MMDIKEYQQKVRAFIEKGDITEEQWKEITNAILNASEGAYGQAMEIDRSILSPEEFDEFYGEDDDVS
jgi:hypothetical protein